VTQDEVFATRGALLPARRHLGDKLRAAQEAGVSDAHLGACVEYGALTGRMEALLIVARAPDLATARALLADDAARYGAQVME
jgi:hypothetical protein